MAASWEENWAAENEARKSEDNEKAARRAALTPRRRIVEEVESAARKRGERMHMGYRRGPMTFANLEARQRKVLKEMKQIERTRKGKSAVKNVIEGRKINRTVPAGQRNIASVRAMRALSREGIARGYRNVEDEIAQMLLGKRPTGKVPIMERLATSRRGKNVTRRVDEARRKKLVALEFDKIHPPKNISKAKSATRSKSRKATRGRAHSR